MSLRKRLGDAEVVRVVGVGDALGARIADRAGADAIWASGLAISLAHGHPDASILTMSEFLQAARFIDRATELPTICDCDTGFGETPNVLRTILDYEAAGLAGICLEDKVFPKRNSFDSGKHHSLIDANTFASRISVGKEKQATDEFALVARTEALVVGESMAEACRRGLLYGRAGADVVLVHSKAPDANEVLEFARRFRDQDDATPLACVPTTYPGKTAAEFSDAGFSIVIWANQASRAAVTGMERAIEHLLTADSSSELEGTIATVQELFDLSGLSDVDRLEELIELRARTLAVETSLQKSVR